MCFAEIYRLALSAKKFTWTQLSADVQILLSSCDILSFKVQEKTAVDLFELTLPKLKSQERLNHDRELWITETH